MATSGLDYDIKLWAPTAENPTGLKGLKEVFPRGFFFNHRIKRARRLCVARPCAASMRSAPAFPFVGDEEEQAGAGRGQHAPRRSVRHPAAVVPDEAHEKQEASEGEHSNSGALSIWTSIRPFSFYRMRRGLLEPLP